MKVNKPRLEWLIVVAFSIVMFGYYGSFLSFSVFLKPLSAEFNWSRVAASGAMSVAAGLAGLLSFVTGNLADKYGARWIIAIGALLGVLGYFLMSHISSLWQMYVFFGLILGVSMSSCWAPINATVARCFTDKRVLAFGIASVGLTIGQMVIPPLMANSITSFGWHTSYLVLAVVVLVCAMPAFILLNRISPLQRRNSINESQQTDSRNRMTVPPLSKQWSALEATKTVQLWMLMVTGFVTSAGFYFLSVHVVANATDLGMSAGYAALILTFMAGSNALSRLFIQPIVNKLGGRFTLFLLFLLQAIALFTFMGATRIWLFFVLASIFGFGFGATSPIRSSMIAHFFGLKSVGTLIGIVEIAWALGAMTGPILAGFIFDYSGSYYIAYMIGGIFMVIGMIATYFLKAPLYAGSRPVSAQ